MADGQARAMLRGGQATPEEPVADKKKASSTLKDPKAGKEEKSKAGADLAKKK